MPKKQSMEARVGKHCLIATAGSALLQCSSLFPTSDATLMVEDLQSYT